VTKTSTTWVTKYIDSYAIIPSGGYNNTSTCGTTPPTTHTYTAATMPAETGGLNSTVFLSAIMAILSYEFIGKYRLARKILKRLFSIGGLSAMMIIFALIGTPFGGVLAQTSTTTVTTTLTLTTCTSYTTVTASTTWVSISYVTWYTTTTDTITRYTTVTQTITSTTTLPRCLQSCWNLCVLFCCGCIVG
jgi:hypothetical protein